jgi:hypothetical protein
MCSSLVGRREKLKAALTCPMRWLYGCTVSDDCLYKKFSVKSACARLLI